MNRETLRDRLGLEPSATDAEIVAAAKAERSRLSRLAAAASSAEAAKVHRDSVAELEAMLAACGLQATTTTPTPSGSALSQTMLRDLPVAVPSGSLSGTNGYAPGSRVPVEPGRVLANRYEVRRLIGAGGMGAVFSAFDRTREEEIAVKVILPGLVENKEARDRFLQEAKIATSLSHPGIVKCFDVAQDGELLFLTMELLEGQTLRERVEAQKRTHQPFPIAEVVKVGKALCEALGYAHQRTVHRDVKPDNVFCCDDGRILLVDFGIAKLLNQSQLTMTGAAMGTAYYMAPEQLMGASRVDHRADQFAVGVMAYELLTGKLPTGMVQPLRNVRIDVPAGLAAAVEKAMASEPAERHADMAAFAGALPRAAGLVAGGSHSRPAQVASLLVGAVVIIAWSFGFAPINGAVSSMFASFDPGARIAEARALAKELNDLRAARSEARTFDVIDKYLERAEREFAAGRDREADGDAAAACSRLFDIRSRSEALRREIQDHATAEFQAEADRLVVERRQEDERRSAENRLQEEARRRQDDAEKAKLEEHRARLAREWEELLQVRKDLRDQCDAITAEARRKMQKVAALSKEMDGVFRGVGFKFTFPAEGDHSGAFSPEYIVEDANKCIQYLERKVEWLDGQSGNGRESAERIIGRCEALLGEARRESAELRTIWRRWQTKHAEFESACQRTVR